MKKESYLENYYEEGNNQPFLFGGENNLVFNEEGTVITRRSRRCNFRSLYFLPKFLELELFVFWENYYEERKFLRELL